MPLTDYQLRITAIDAGYELYLDRLIDGLHRVVAQTADAEDEDMAATVRHATQAIITLRHARDRALEILRDSTYA